MRYVYDPIVRLSPESRRAKQADHSCCACPVEVRDLLATAHNALGAYERGDDPSRTRRKMAELRAAHDRLAEVSREHFRALGYSDRSEMSDG